MSTSTIFTLLPLFPFRDSTVSTPTSYRTHPGPSKMEPSIWILGFHELDFEVLVGLRHRTVSFELVQCVRAKAGYKDAYYTVALGGAAGRERLNTGGAYRSMILTLSLFVAKTLDMTKKDLE